MISWHIRQRQPPAAACEAKINFDAELENNSVV
jgi:hypothetical protein